MKVNLYKNIDGIPIYIDNYMEDHQVLKGIKGNDLKYYLICNKKTCKLMYSDFQKKLRNQKLKKILK